MCQVKVGLHFFCLSLLFCPTNTALHRHLIRFSRHRLPNHPTALIAMAEFPWSARLGSTAPPTENTSFPVESGRRFNICDNYAQAINSIPLCESKYSIHLCVRLNQYERHPLHW
jgi:hypothetical protein